MVQVTKVLVYLLVFVIVLGSGVIAKGMILLMTSQLKHDRKIGYCNKELGENRLQSPLLVPMRKVKTVVIYIFDFKH